MVHKSDSQDVLSASLWTSVCLLCLQKQRVCRCLLWRAWGEFTGCFSSQQADSKALNLIFPAWGMRADRILFCLTLSFHNRFFARLSSLFTEISLPFRLCYILCTSSCHNLLSKVHWELLLRSWDFFSMSGFAAAAKLRVGRHKTHTKEWLLGSISRLP